MSISKALTLFSIMIEKIINHISKRIFLASKLFSTMQEHRVSFASPNGPGASGPSAFTQPPMPGSHTIAQAAAKPIPGSPPSEQIMPARGALSSSGRLSLYLWTPPIEGTLQRFRILRCMPMRLLS